MGIVGNVLGLDAMAMLEFRVKCPFSKEPDGKHYVRVFSKLHRDDGDYVYDHEVYGHVETQCYDMAGPGHRVVKQGCAAAEREVHAAAKSHVVDPGHTTITTRHWLGELSTVRVQRRAYGEVELVDPINTVASHRLYDRKYTLIMAITGADPQNASEIMRMLKHASSPSALYFPPKVINKHHICRLCWSFTDAYSFHTHARGQRHMAHELDLRLTVFNSYHKNIAGTQAELTKLVKEAQVARLANVTTVAKFLNFMSSLTCKSLLTMEKVVNIIENGTLPILSPAEAELINKFVAKYTRKQARQCTTNKQP